MRKLLVAALVLALLLLAIPERASASEIRRPAWTAGDFWTYRTNTTLAPGLNLTGVATSTVTGTLAGPVDGSPMGSYRVVLSGSGTTGGTLTTPNGSVSIQGQWSLTGEEHYEPENLQLVYSLLDLSVNGTYDYLVPLPFSLRFQNTTVLQIVGSPMQYPYTVGTSGSVAVAYNFTQDVSSPMAGTLHENGTGRTNLTWSVDTPAMVSTPAGTFQADRIWEARIDGTRRARWYADSVGNDVRATGFDSAGNQTSDDQLTAYRYQAAETPTFLGLTAVGWALVAVGVGAAAVGAFLWIRRSRRRRAQGGIPPP